MADDNEKQQQGKPLAKSLESIAALRALMEQRLAKSQKAAEDARATSPSSSASKENEKISPKTSSGDASFSAKAKASKSENAFKEQPFNFGRAADPGEWSRIMFRIAERSRQLIQDFLSRNRERLPEIPPVLDPAHLSEAFIELSNRILSDPERFVEAQLSLWQGYARIGQAMIARMQGKEPPPVVTPAPSDKRFQDPAWQNVWLFDFIKQSYLLTAGWVHGFVRKETEGLDPKLAQKIEFYTRQMVDAIAPSNFWLTNPEVLRATFESGGENLIKGLENMLTDIERGHGQLRINMSDAKFFKVGENLATTPGKVVFQNELMQLIQFSPSTPNVHRVPLLIIPPWINKYYILDLGEKKSFIHYLVAQGYTVFCVSWVNPDERHAKINFEDYMTLGSLAAMREIQKATGEDDISIVGYCIGGTLLATTLAYLKATPKAPDLPTIKSATFLVTLTDFSQPGDLGVFMDEEQISAIEAMMAKKGYLDAAAMGATFNMLRANDLIWSFVVNNYLLGKEPFPFDILCWNADSTNLPAAMHSFYLRKMYLENKLIEPGGVGMKNVPIDLHTIETPSFFLSTREDHIAPWRATYAATQVFRGPVTFVLSGSGHIAGIVNPPAAKKYGYWTNGGAFPAKPDDWLEHTTQHEGSWWPYWLEWLKPYAGDDAPAREIKNGLEDAPGSYVKVKAF